MKNTDPRVDAYIEKANDFAKPILAKLRKLVHQAAPSSTETIKWGMPSFEYKGPLCGMAAFKQHAVFGFWKASLMKDDTNTLKANAMQGGDAMGNLGRICSVKDLPKDAVLLRLIKQAVKLNDDGVKVLKPKKAHKPLPAVPAELRNALKKNMAAADFFETLSQSHKREYIEWASEAKAEGTRIKRAETAVVWLSEGKNRNWKYERKK